MALGVGVGLFVAGSGAGSDADAIAAEIPKSGDTTCGDNPSGSLATKCAEGQDKQSTAHTLDLAGGVIAGVGGAIAIGGVVYLIWAATSEAPAETAQFQPWMSPGLAGGAFQGSF